MSVSNTRWLTDSKTKATSSTSTSTSLSIFKSIAVSGQTTVSALNDSDTLTLVAGTGITLTTSGQALTITGSATTGDISFSGSNITSSGARVSILDQVTITPAADSTTSFLVEKADGTDIFAIDTTNSKLVLGTGIFELPDSNIGIGNSVAFHANATENIAIGKQALDGTTGTAQRNVAIGVYALTSLQTGDNNVALGFTTGQSLTTASDNMLIGKGAGNKITNSGANTLIGANAGYQITTSSGAKNTGIGSYSLYKAGGNPNENVAIGYYSIGKGHSTGDDYSGNSPSYNVAIGNYTLGGAPTFSNDTQQDSLYGIAIGHEAMTFSESGQHNTAVGYLSGKYLTTGSYNMFIGGSTGGSGSSTALTGDNNYAIGYGAGNNIQGTCSGTMYIGRSAGASTTTSGIGNTGIGYYALSGTVNSLRNTAIGYEALKVHNTAGADYGNNVGIGYKSLNVLTIGKDNTALGANSGIALTEGNDNILIGSGGLGLTTGDKNLVIGNYAGNAITTEENGTFIGYKAGQHTTGASRALYIGYYAGLYLQGGDDNLLLGGLAMGSGNTSDKSQNSGYKNIAIGYKTIGGNIGSGDNLTAFYNVALGYESMKNATSAQYNICLGALAGTVMSTGSFNVGIGYNSIQAMTTGTGNLAIGANALRTAVADRSNIAIGKESLYYLNNSSNYGYNVAIGENAGREATISQYSFFLGSDAGRYVTTAKNNVAIGYQTLGAGKSANRLRGYGDGGGMASYSGERNIAIGYRALYELSNSVASDNSLIIGTSASSYNNTVIGAYAGIRMITAKQNTLIGAETGQKMLGNLNTVIGTASCYNSHYVSGATVIGGATMGSYSGEDYAVAIGVGAFKNLRNVGRISTVDDTTPTPSSAWQASQTHTNISPTSDDSTNGTETTFDIVTDGSGNPTFTVNARGYNYQSDDELTFTDPGSTSNTAVLVVNALKTDNGQIAIGYNAGYDLQQGTNNVLIGKEAGSNIISASGTVAIGAWAGYYHESGDRNIFIGRGAGQGVTGNRLTGGSNICIGDYAGSKLQGTATQNHLIGDGAGDNITTGWQNFAIGRHSLDAEVAGNRSVAIGNAALSDATQATNTQVENTAIGYGAGDVITSGIECTFIGGSSNGDATSSGQVAIGQSAVTQNANEVRIGYQGAFQLYSVEAECGLGGTDENDPSHSTPLFKIPQYAIIKSATAVVTQLSSVAHHKLKLVLSTDSSGTDNTVLNNIQEIIGAGADNSWSGSASDGTAKDIDAGSTAANLKVAYATTVLGNDTGLSSIDTTSADQYVYLAFADASYTGGDGQPGTNPKVRVCIEFVGED